VTDRRTADLTESVPMDPYDLAGWTLSLFDYIIANPDVVRLSLWQQLERPEQCRCSIEVDYEPYVNRVAEAQREGKVTTAVSALDLIVMLAGLAQAWYLAFAARLMFDDDQAWSGRLLKSHRAALEIGAKALLSQ
jgi:hypothetical protein